MGNGVISPPRKVLLVPTHHRLSGKGKNCFSNQKCKKFWFNIILFLQSTFAVVVACHCHYHCHLHCSLCCSIFVPQCLLFHAMAFCAAVFALCSVAFAFCAVAFAICALALVLHAAAFAVCAMWFLFVLQHLQHGCAAALLHVDWQHCMSSCNIACQVAAFCIMPQHCSLCNGLAHHSRPLCFIPGC